MRAGGGLGELPGGVLTQCPKKGQKYTEWCRLRRGGSETHQQQERGLATISADNFRKKGSRLSSPADL